MKRRNNPSPKRRSEIREPETPTTLGRFWLKLRQPVWWKLLTTVLLVLVSLPLYWGFIQGKDINAQFVVTLSLVSLIFFIWAWPNFKLGLTAIFLLTQPLILYLGNTEYNQTKVFFSVAFISLLLIVWFGEMALRGRAQVERTPLFWPTVFLLVAALLSLINSQALLGDLQYVVFFLYFVGFYLYLANVLEQPKELRFLLGALLVASGLAAIYAFLQYFGILLGAPGYPKGNPGVIISTFGNKNYFGGFLAYLFVPALSLLLGSHERWVKASALGILGLIYVTLLAISSESAWIAILLSLVVLLFGLWFTRSVDSLRLNWRWMLGLAGVMMALTLGLLIGTVFGVTGKSLSLSAVAQVAQRFSALGWLALMAVAGLPLAAGLIRLWQSGERRWKWASVGTLLIVVMVFMVSPIGSGLYQSLLRTVNKSSNVRVEDWWISYEMFKSQPILGIGLGDFKREFLAYKAPFLQTEQGQYYKEKVGVIQRAAQAHNEYVQFTAEMGIVGLLAMAFAIFVIFRSAWQRLKKNTAPERRLWVLALLAGVVAFMSDSLFSFPLHLPSNVLALVFLLGALQSRALTEEGAPSPALSLGEQGSWMAASLVFLVLFIANIFAYREWQADVYLDTGQRLSQFAGTPSERAEAKATLEKSLRLSLAPGEVFYWLGLLAQSEEGDYQKSRDLLERSLPHYNTETTYYELIRVNLQLADQARVNKNAEEFKSYLQEAERYDKLLLAIDPAPRLQLDALYFQAYILLQRGQISEARKRLEELLQQYPEGENILLTLGQIYLKQAIFDRARQAFEQALTLINRKLAEIGKRLQPGTKVRTDVAAALLADQRNLANLKAGVEEALRQLPK